MLKKVRKAIAKALDIDEQEEAFIANNIAMSCGDEKLFAKMKSFMDRRGTGVEIREWQKLLDSRGVYNKKLVQNPDLYYWSACDKYAKLCYANSGGVSRLKIGVAHHNVNDIAASTRIIQRNPKSSNALIIDLPGFYNANATFLMAAKFLASVKGPVDYRMFERSPGLISNMSKRTPPTNKLSREYKSYLDLLTARILKDCSPNKELRLRASDIGVFEALYVLRRFIASSAIKKKALPRIRLELSDVDLAMPILGARTKSGELDYALKELCQSIRDVLNMCYHGYDKSLLEVNIATRGGLRNAKRPAAVAVGVKETGSEKEKLNNKTKGFIKDLKKAAQVSWKVLPEEGLDGLYARVSAVFLDGVGVKAAVKPQDGSEESIAPLVSGKDVLDSAQQHNSSLLRNSRKK